MSHGHGRSSGRPMITEAFGSRGPGIRQILRLMDSGPSWSLSAGRPKAGAVGRGRNDDFYWHEGLFNSLLEARLHA
jgi:hypothetical protein